MTKATVSLQAINDVKDFVNIVMKYDFDIDLVSGRYAVDKVDHGYFQPGPL